LRCLSPPRPCSPPFPYTTLFRSLDQRLVLETDAPVDAPVQIARGAHLAARVRVHVGDLANQGLGGRYRQELHEVDLVGVDELARSEEHTSELQSPYDLVCRLLLE